MRTALLLAVLVPAAAHAGPARLAGGTKAEDKLRRFVREDARLKARLADAARREEAFLAESRESDLRDAVSDAGSVDAMRAELERAPSERRKAMLEAMPGMKAPAAPDASCRTLAECPVPELALDVPDAERLPDALRRLVRPWMALQQARGSEILVDSVEGPADAALTVKLKDIDAEPLVLNVSPRLLGGFKVWYDKPLVLSALYNRERDAALRR